MLRTALKLAAAVVATSQLWALAEVDFQVAGSDGALAQQTVAVAQFTPAPVRLAAAAIDQAGSAGSLLTTAPVSMPLSYEVTNAAFVEQAERIATPASVPADSTGNLSLIEDLGLANSATVEQTGLSNTSLITQSGIGNECTVFQSSNGNVSMVSQTGSNGPVSVHQGAI